MATPNELVIESMIQAKQLNAPRLSPASIDSVIVEEAYYQFPTTTVTVCLFKLKNGFLCPWRKCCSKSRKF